jgi:hypothetical protein
MSEDFKISQVITFIGCTEEEARQYLDQNEWDVLKTVENTVIIPSISGMKYIPPEKKINDGLTDEVREKLKTARGLSDAFTASFRNDLLQVQKKGEDAVEQEQEQTAQVELPEVE